MPAFHWLTERAAMPCTGTLSYAVTTLKDDTGVSGTGLAFNIGEGSERVYKAAQFYAEKLKGKDIQYLMSDFGNIFR